MAKKGSGSLMGALLLLAPFVWVCSLCDGDDSRPAATPSAERRPEILGEVEVQVHASERPEAEAEAAPVQPEKRRHRRRRSHHEEEAKVPEMSEAQTHAEHSKTVDPWAESATAEPAGAPTASDIDQALKDARKSPSSRPSKSRPAASAPSRTCCKHCGPTSKPCGNSCISRSKTCHKGVGCAC